MSAAQPSAEVPEVHIPEKGSEGAQSGSGAIAALCIEQHKPQIEACEGAAGTSVPAQDGQRCTSWPDSTRQKAALIAILVSVFLGSCIFTALLREGRPDENAEVCPKDYVLTEEENGHRRCCTKQPEDNSGNARSELQGRRLVRTALNAKNVVEALRNKKLETDLDDLKDWLTCSTEETEGNDTFGTVWENYETARNMADKMISRAPSVGDKVKIRSTERTQDVFRANINKVFRISKVWKDSRGYQVEGHDDTNLDRHDIIFLTIPTEKDLAKSVKAFVMDWLTVVEARREFQIKEFETLGPELLEVEKPKDKSPEKAKAEKGRSKPAAERLEQSSARAVLDIRRDDDKGGLALLKPGKDHNEPQFYKPRADWATGKSANTERPSSPSQAVKEANFQLKKCRNKLYYVRKEVANTGINNNNLVDFLKRIGEAQALSKKVDNVLCEDSQMRVKENTKKLLEQESSLWRKLPWKAKFCALAIWGAVPCCFIEVMRKAGGVGPAIEKNSLSPPEFFHSFPELQQKQALDAIKLEAFRLRPRPDERERAEAAKFEAEASSSEREEEKEDEGVLELSVSDEEEEEAAAMSTLVEERDAVKLDGFVDFSKFDDEKKQEEWICLGFVAVCVKPNVAIPTFLQ